MTISFYKYHGTGNDFIIIDNRENEYRDISALQVKELCHRRFGIGADGLILLGLRSGCDFDMIYYNSDGLPGSMRGNGARCTVQFAYDLGIRQPGYSFIAADGLHEANFNENGWIRLKMGDVTSVSKYNTDRVLNTGSPHYIKIVDNVKHYNVVEEGRRIRYNDDYKKKGINVNFVEQEHNNIMVRTYERGVEDETLSCGTGVTASALISAHNERGFNRVEVKTLGGHLAVEFDKINDEQFKNIWLCGPAAFVFKGKIEV